MAKSKAISKKHTEPAKPASRGETCGENAEIAAAKDFPIVGIGASAGGLAAFGTFLTAMPFATEKGMSFVLVQHLSPDYKSVLSELVSRYTRMRVHEVEDGMEVEANRVYIIPPNCDMALLSGKLHLFPLTGERGLRHSIDYFFRSLASDQHEYAVGIVLSGTGSDGTLGLRAIKAEGGLAIAQTPESSEFDGMPRSAIATGLVDYILPPAEMPARLIAYAKHIFIRKPQLKELPKPHSADVLAKICVMLRATTGHDFSQYKESTIIRRIQRRMALQQVEQASDYLQFLQNNASETEALFRDLLIGVTSFFRDPEAFESLRTIAIPRLFDGVPPGGSIRVWVCGCSTGEEAYSVAILIQEHLEKLQQVFKVQIFATDIDRKATEQARLGVFQQGIAADIPEERLSRYFAQDSDGSFRVRKVIRDLLIFSEQDVVKDPPFSKIGLVCCRNVLIYMNGDLQRRIIALFQFSLSAGGMLFLGNSESVGDHSQQFEPLDRKAKLYFCKALPSDEPPRLSDLLGQSSGTAVSLTRVRTGSDPRFNPRELTEQTLLRHSSPASVLVKESGTILYFHGRTGNYLEPSPGDAASNVLAMAREGLRRELTSGLGRAGLQKEPVVVKNVLVKANGHYIKVDLTIIPVVTPAAVAAMRLFLIVFTEQATAEPSQAGAGDAHVRDPADVPDRVRALENELRTKDEYIQTVIEEMETSGEELKASNEEMQSVNEELQSTNEELETSKEELQSVNEELATVNAELMQRVNDLSRSNNDVNNLLAGTGVGTLFVDLQLRISRFTPSVSKLINLIPGDIGRPLAHIVSNLLNYEQLIASIQSVLDTLTPIEEEVQTKSGSWYLLGVRPYRTLDNIIEGAVVTFVDITSRRMAEERLREAERFRAAAEIETVGIVFFRVDGSITSANDAFLRMGGYDREALEAGGIHWDNLTDVSERLQYRKAMEDLRSLGYMGQRLRTFISRDGTQHSAMFTARRISETEAVGYLMEVPMVLSAAVPTDS